MEETLFLLLRVETIFVLGSACFKYFNKKNMYSLLKLEVEIVNPVVKFCSIKILRKKSKHFSVSYYRVKIIFEIFFFTFLHYF
jgi:hypothetical protein